MSIRQETGDYDSKCMSYFKQTACGKEWAEPGVRNLKNSCNSSVCSHVTSESGDCLEISDGINILHTILVDLGMNKSG